MQGGTITKSSGPSLADFREYNHEQLLDWLAAHACGGPGRDGGGIRRIDKRHRPGPGTPLNGEMFRDLFDADYRFTDKAMRGVLVDFERECPLRHVLLTPVYFAAEPSPAMAEQWRLWALRDASRQYADLYEHYLRSIRWMLARVEERLDKEKRMRLVAPSPYPWDLRTLRPKWLQDEARRRRIRCFFYKYLEELGDEEKAHRSAAQAIGYSERMVREGIVAKQPTWKGW